MENFALFYVECSNLVNDYNDEKKSRDYAGEVVISKSKNLGNIKLCFRELHDKPNRVFFFILYIVESTNVENLNFNKPLWEKDASISRIIKVSGDYNNSIVISMADKISDNKEMEPIVIGKIIIPKYGEKGNLYLYNNSLVEVSVSDIINSIENLNINRFFNGFIKNKKTK